MVHFITGLLVQHKTKNMAQYAEKKMEITDRLGLDKKVNLQYVNCIARVGFRPEIKTKRNLCPCLLSTLQEGFVFAGI